MPILRLRSTTRAPRLALALLLAALAPTARASINTIPEWESRVAKSNSGGLPFVSQNVLPDQDAYAWAGYQWVQGYLSLAQATGEARHMDSAKAILDHMLAHRDDIRFAGKPLDAPYFYAPTQFLYHEGTPAPGWRRRTWGGGKTHTQVSVLIDGRICEIFLRWCELARRSFPQYEADVARYLDRVHETIEIHQPSFREISPSVNVGPSIYTPALPAGGFHHWWHDNKLVDKPTSPEPRVFSGQLPLNHSVTMASAMFAYDRLRGTTAYRQKVQLVVNFILNSLDPARPDRAIWEYDPVNPRRHDIEDIGHAAISLPLLQDAYRDGGFGVTADHMRRLTATYLACFDETTGFPHRYIDGTEKPGEAPGETYGMRAAACFYAWLWFSQYDPAVLTKARRAYEAYFGDRAPSAFNMGGWANLLYWEKVRDGTAAIPDRAPPLSSSTPAPAR